MPTIFEHAWDGDAEEVQRLVTATGASVNTADEKVLDNIISSA